MNKSMFTKSFTISIPALREEGDRFLVATGMLCTDFYPRPPRGGRPGFRAGSCNHQPISIPALREEGDHGLLPGILAQCRDFYPRPPRGGRPPHQKSTGVLQTKVNS